MFTNLDKKHGPSSLNIYDHLLTENKFYPAGNFDQIKNHAKRSYAALHYMYIVLQSS